MQRKKDLHEVNKTVRVDQDISRKIIFSIVIFVFLIYGNGIKNRFSMDDRHVTVTNAKVPDNAHVAKGIKGIPEIFTSHYVESDVQSFDYRPLPLVIFAIEYQFFGCNPHVNHFFNILIYAVTCVLLFLLLRQLFKGYALIFPLLITFLFAAHPVHTEVVNNIKCRDELMAFFFGLLSLHYFLKIESTEKKKWVPVLKAALFLFAALLCKISALIFIGMILLSIWFFTKAGLKKIGLSFLLIFLVYASYVIFKRSMLVEIHEVRNFTFYENPLYFNRSAIERINTALVTTGYYARLLIFPYPLCFYYGYNAVAMDGPGSIWFWFSLVIYGIAIVYVIRKIKQKDILAYGILVFLMGLAPFANLLVPVVGILGERFIYFASLGFCMIAAYLIVRFSGTDLRNDKSRIKDMKPALKRAVGAILLIFSILVVMRNPKWKDLLTLSENDVAHFEDSYMLQSFVANNLNAQIAVMPQGYKKSAMIEEAKRRYALSGEILRKGLEKNENDYFSMTTLGTMYSNYLNKPDEAILFFKKALQKKPDYEIAWYNLYYCYQLKGFTDSAIVCFQRMVDGGTKYQPVFLRLHELYLQKKQIGKAIANDKKALEKYPEDVKLNLNLGNDYIVQADTLTGIKYFEKAASLAPGDYALNRKMAEIFNTIGNKAKAMEYGRKANEALKNTPD